MDAAGEALSWWPAPAKLNLFLHVTGRRGDGYHELSTAFQFLDFGDSLAFAPRSDGRVRLLDPTPGVAPADDLVVRAARALRAQAGVAAGADIRLVKRIPLGGGLGGASSDAATTLVALDALWNARLGVERLAALGLALGADVPVFVRGGAAFAAGIGELLRPARFAEPWYVVVHPGVAVSTREIFTAPELTRSSQPVTMTNFSLERARNDCEPVARSRYPEVGRALDWLRARGPARLTGTGSCVFTWRESRAQAEALAEQVTVPWRAFVARGRNRSPLLDRLDAEAGAPGQGFADGA